ncbi:MAG: hypothetical protein QOG41_422, partial [Thermoleophilaceae bacterium]|nr:hypothetical protein [Thermoleophilaceae bacterium]
MMCLAAASPAFAATTRYASPAGSGPSATCPQVDPCSLVDAVNGAGTGDEVVVTPGDYALTDTLNVQDDLSIHGQAGQPRPVISYSGGGNAIFESLGVNELDVTHLEIDAPGGTAIYGETCSGTWEDLLVTGSAAVVCYGGNDFVSPLAVAFRDTVAHSTGTGQRALLLASSMSFGDSTYTLRNVTAIASGSAAHAIEVHALSDATDTVDAMNVVARGTGTSDLRVHGGSTTGTAKLQISYSNYGTEDHSGVAGDEAGTLDVSGGHNQTDVPLFVNAAAGNFHEQASSPTVDAGTEDPKNGPTDIDGDARELGLAPDIGADEYAAPSSAMAIGRAHAQGVLLHDGKVLVAGGNFGGVYPRNAELFDPGAGRWSNGGYLSKGRQFAAASVLESGKVIVSGGFNGSVLGDADLYDPTTNKWTAGGTFPGSNKPRWRHTSTLLGTGKVLVTGGQNALNVALKTTAVYNPATNTWTAGTPLAAERYSHTATLLGDGRVLVVGGYNGAAALTSAEVSNVDANGWTAAGNMATGRYDHTATLLQDGRVLVAGGVDSGGQETDTAELYDPASNTWSQAGHLAQARTFHTATLLRDGRVLVQGGTAPGLGALNSTEIYNPATNSWSAGPSLAVARNGLTSTGLLDGRVLAAGGEGIASSERTAAFAPNAVARRPVVAYVDLQGHFGLFDSETGKDLPSPPVPAGLTRFATSLDGRYVVYADAAQKIHLYDRRAKAAVPLPGIDEGGSANLTVSNTGLIGFDHNSNGPAQVYDSKAKAFRDVGFDPVNGHRQTWLSGDGHWLATTCADHCVTDPGGEPDLFVQN